MAESTLTPTCCAACGQDTGGDDICPSCFAPQQKKPIFSTVKSEAWEFPELPPVDPVRRNAVRLDQVTFRPTSALSRFLTRYRGFFASTLLTLLFVCLGAYFYLDHFGSEAERFAQYAQQTFKDGQVQKSKAHWERALQNYRMIFDDAGRARCLSEMARCEQRKQDYSKAIAYLERAKAIENDPSFEDRIYKCYRVQASDQSEDAKLALKDGSYEEAIVASEAALESFKRGRGTNAQFAKTERLAAQAAIGLRDFEAAEFHLDEAKEYEGDTKANRSLANLYTKRLALAKKQNNESPSEWKAIAGEMQPVQYRGSKRKKRTNNWSYSSTKNKSKRKKPRTRGSSKYKAPSYQSIPSYSTQRTHRPKTYSAPSYPSARPKYSKPPTYNPSQFSRPASRPNYSRPSYSAPSAPRPRVNVPRSSSRPQGRW